MPTQTPDPDMTHRPSPQGSVRRTQRGPVSALEAARPPSERQDEAIEEPAADVAVETALDAERGSAPPLSERDRQLEELRKFRVRTVPPSWRALWMGLRASTPPSDGPPPIATRDEVAEEPSPDRASAGAEDGRPTRPIDILHRLPPWVRGLAAAVLVFGLGVGLAFFVPEGPQSAETRPPVPLAPPRAAAEEPEPIDEAHERTPAVHADEAPAPEALSEERAETRAERRRATPAPEPPRPPRPERASVRSAPARASRAQSAPTVTKKPAPRQPPAASAPTSHSILDKPLAPPVE